VDSRHIVPDALGKVYKLAYALQDAIRRSEFFVDALLIGLTAPDFAPEASPVGMNCCRDAKTSDQGYEKVDFIFNGNPMAQFEF
jgi:hypothetical protein